MKKLFLLGVFMLLSFSGLRAQRQMETLDRGLVAVKVPSGVYTSWRITGDEWYDVTYNIYRDGTKLNDEPLTVSNFIDRSGSASSSYTVRAVVGGVEQPACAPVSVWGQQYMQIKMSDLYSKNGHLMNNAYTINDACAADLDGDGVYELIVKRMNTDFTLANDTAYCLFQAYKLDGTLLWTLDMGPNLINAGHVETNCVAFDFDEDGKAEVVLRATDGTILPDGTVIGNAKVNYRPVGGRDYQVDGDEWLVVLNGATGALIDKVIFDTDPVNGNNLARRSAAFWWNGNSKAYGHRANKFHFGAPYLDGRHPSIYLGRGCYTNLHMATYDLVNGKLQRRWAYYTDDTSSPFYGQGYHNFCIVDVDMDGRDEICHGNCVIDDDGTELSSTGLGHGDAQHYGDLDPYRKGVEGFRCLEDNPGAVFVDAATSEILFRWIRGNDCGRCLAGNFTDDFPGAELWTVDGHLWSASTSRAADQVAATTAPGVTMNYRIYWDGDILDESFDYASRTSVGDGLDPSVFKYGNGSPIFSATGCMTNNNTKGNPCLQADLFGDWREEICVRTSDNRYIRIYTTTALTSHRNYSLMYDFQYRQAIYWQMCAYNQPPHVSYFLGNLEGIVLPPPPACSNGKQEITDALSSNADGKFVMMAQTKNTTVNVNGTVKPSNVMVNTPADYVIKGGTWSGDMRFIKMGLGKMTLSGCTLNHTGNTEVWGGTLVNESDITGSHLILKRFAEADLTGAYKKGIKMEYGAVLRPTSSASSLATLTASCLDMDGGAVLELNVNGQGQTDIVTVDTLRLGAANPIGATPVIRVVRGGTLEAGDYTLVQATKSLQGNVNAITIEGLEGVSYELVAGDKSVILRVKAQRAAASVYWSGAVNSIWNLNDVQNFVNGGTSDVFVSGDAVTFDASAVNKTVTVAENVEPSSVVVEGDDDYTFQGSGMISGTTGLVKNGNGTLYVNNENNFTGGVRINGGTVSVATLSDAQNVGALGAYTTEKGKFYIGEGATLRATAALTNACPIEVGNGAVINNSGTFTQNAAVSGGTLIKKGAGTLIFREHNAIKKLEIESGTVNIPVEYQNQTALGDTVVLRGGTLQFEDNSYTYAQSYSAWVVPEGAKATARLDSRCNYRGTLHGSGELTIYVPAYYRTYMYGDWSKFTGTLKATGAKSASYPIVFTNTYGLPNATLNIPNAGDVVQLGDGNASTSGTFRIGELTGVGTLAAGSNASNTFEVGSKNTDFSFGGISNATINKVGTGVMSMTANTGSGAINVVEGTLRVYNSITSTTTATGTGLITVKDGGVLTGRGYMGNSKVVVENGGVFRPGLLYLSVLNLTGTLTLNEGGVLELRINTNTTNSSISIGTAALMRGTVRILTRSDYVPKIGDTFSFWTCKTFNKNYTPTLELPELPAGMKWDTSQLCTTEGRLTIVADENGIADITYDTEVTVSVTGLNGVEVTTFTSAYGMVNANMAAADVPGGVYLLNIRSAAGTEVRKYFKR